MGIAGIRFGHVAFRTADVERSVRWYADAFGAQKVFHAPQEGERQELMFLEFAKGQCVELFTRGQEKTPAPSSAIGYQHFYLVVNDLDQALKHLAAINIYP